MNAGFIKLMRTDVTKELLKDPKSWALLSLIAYRAKWSKGLSVHNLEQGQALIGDADACGLSAKEYRTAKKKLSQWGLVACKATNKGTVATLLNADVYDVNSDHQGEQRDNQKASERQSRGEQGATNEECKDRTRKLKPESKPFRKIDIQGYGSIHDEQNDAIDVAFSVTGEPDSLIAENSYRNLLKAVGEKKFRDCVADLWGEMKTDKIDRPGAILTNKLKTWRGKDGKR